MNTKNLTFHEVSQILADYDYVKRLFFNDLEDDEQLICFNPAAEVTKKIKALKDESAAVLFSIACLIEQAYILIPSPEIWTKQLNISHDDFLTDLNELAEAKLVIPYKTQKGLALYPSPDVVFSPDKNSINFAKVFLSQDKTRQLHLSSSEFYLPQNEVVLL